MSYIPHTPQDLEQMCKVLGITDIDELFTDIDSSIRNPEMDLAPGLDPIALQHEMQTLAQQNQHLQLNSFLGAGAYQHFIPAVVKQLSARSEFFTSYTPYQPEMSQGLLQSIFEYQSMICELTGMDVSNASLYDGATALWEAILMAGRVTRRRKVIMLEPLHPHYRSVIETHAAGLDWTVLTIPAHEDGINWSILESELQTDIAAVVAQYPNFYGSIEDLSGVKTLCEKTDSLFILSSHPIALAAYRTPFELGADIATGEGQPLGQSLAFGGPYLGFLACRQKFTRQLPGRLCGQTVDAQEQVGYVLTLQTREQHIRREKATSNICSNQALLALRAAIYLAYMGPEGLKSIALACIKRTHYLKQKLQDVPRLHVLNQQPLFCELWVQGPEMWSAAEAVKRGLPHNLLIGQAVSEFSAQSSSASNEDQERQLLISVSETQSKADLDQLIDFLHSDTASYSQNHSSEPLSISNAAGIRPDDF